MKIHHIVSEIAVNAEKHGGVWNVELRPGNASVGLVIDTRAANIKLPAGDCLFERYLTPYSGYAFEKIAPNKDGSFPVEAGHVYEESGSGGLAIALKGSHAVYAGYTYIDLTKE